MKGHPTYRLHCRLRQIMTERGMTVDELHRLARVSCETICQLRNNNAKRVSLQAIANICGVLGITANDLFEHLVEDIWLPVRLAGELTVHVGSNTLTQPRPATKGGEEVMIPRQFIGSWDFQAMDRISEYLRRIHPGVVIRFRQHSSAMPGSIDKGISAAAEGIFEKGNHLILGSPISNQLCEQVVCRAFGVPAFDPHARDCFPYGHAWNGWKQVASSFGWQGHGKQVGIAALPSNKIVAPCNVVTEGRGTDGALIVVYRIFEPPTKRESGDADERIIICLSGHSGIGTLAAAKVATDPTWAAGLYPPNRAVPRVRAVGCTYNRPHSNGLFDNRELIDETLLPDHQNPPPMLRAFGGKKR